MMHRAYCPDRIPGYEGRRWDREEVKTCSVEGCSRPHSALSFCHNHYERWRRHGDTDLVPPRPPPVIPSPEEIVAEMTAALDRLRAEVER